MGMSIEELITFCEEEEQNHRVKAKRADDASGYTRSKDKNIKTAVAIREEVYGDFYKQIVDTMRKYQQIKNIICKWEVGIYDDEGLCHTEVLELISDKVNGNGNVD